LGVSVAVGEIYVHDRGNAHVAGQLDIEVARLAALVCPIKMIPLKEIL
jgi:hypothetical protein